MYKLNQIKASAGSGKTYQLTELFIQALASSGGGNIAGALGGILAITFTNAAAADMRNKVIEKLKNSALGKNRDSDIPAEKAAQWLDVILKDMDNLNIRTIDSLLHQIVRAAALDLNLHPDFVPVFNTREALEPFLELFLLEIEKDENKAARDLLDEACQVLASKGEFSDSGKKRAKFTGEEAFFETLYVFADSILKNEFSDLASATEIRSKLKEIHQNTILVAQAFLDAGDAEAANGGMPWAANYEKALRSIVAGEVSKLEQKSALDSSVEKFFKKKKGCQIPQNVVDAFEKYHLWVKRLSECYKILDEAIKYAPFITLANSLAAGFRNNMSREEICPTVLVPKMANEAMLSSSGVSETLIRLGNVLTHFLIDEFQDTSLEQWDALEPLVSNALAENGTLTWVGDIKQSVYGWRGAEPALFDDILKRLRPLYSDRQLNRGSLEINWRSYPQIVNFNNRIFIPLGETCADKENSFSWKLVQNSITGIPPEILEKAYERISSAFTDTKQEVSEKHAHEKGYVQIREVPPGSQKKFTPEMAEEIVNLVDEISKRRPLSDIMVLCRDNFQAAFIAENLIKHDINVITSSSLLLSKHPLIIQTVSFLRFLENQGDDIAFWNLVTGSLLGKYMTDEQRQKLALCAGGRNNFARRFAREYEEDWQALLKPFSRLAKLLTPYDMVSEWYKFLDAENRFPKDRTFLRRFLEILHQTEMDGIDTLSDFLNWWQAAGEEEKAPMPEKMDAVRIMTIHKAKGLQAPVTIVPWTNFMVKSNKLDPIMMNVEGINMVLPIIKDCGEPYYQRAANQFAEILNLLYVAFTRAKEELYIFIPPPETRWYEKFAIIQLLKKANISPQPFISFGEKPGQAGDTHNVKSADKDGCVENDATLRQSGNEDRKNECVHPEKRAPMDWLPKMNVYQHIYKWKNRNQEIENQGAEDFIFFTADMRGTFLHFCIENMQNCFSPEETARKALDFGLAYSGIRVPNDEGIRSQLYAALLWFANLPQREHWLAEGLTEQSIINADGQIMRVDNMVREPWGTLILDYKSGHLDDKHTLQVREYIDCLSQCPGFSNKVKGLLIYLDEKKFMLVNSDSVSQPLDQVPENLLSE